MKIDTQEIDKKTTKLNDKTTRCWMINNGKVAGVLSAQTVRSY